MYAEAAKVRHDSIRYCDTGSYRWLWTHAPCSWRGNVELQFSIVPMASLRPAASLTDPAIVVAHRQHMREGRSVAPLVVCANGEGGWYIHDGNHRYHAMRSLFAGHDEAEVRVAVAVPNAGFRFVYRWFETYGTYLLEPVSPLLDQRSFRGRTMVLVAHQDDETACAGFLQRIIDPIVVFATNGAPTDEYFWGRHGSRANYAAVRRNEAHAALAKIGVVNSYFLNEHATPEIEFRDQQLYRVLPEAFQAVSTLVRLYRPDSVLVPAYEGGHPDHECCSFLGALLRRQLGLTVWEMPLYHRADSGTLTCQRFRTPNGTERSVVLGRAENQLREIMIAMYASQADVRDFVPSGVELFRPQAEYDYSLPPYPGRMNYEVWRWPISAAGVCRAFEACTRAVEAVQTTCFTTCGLAEQTQATVAASAGA